MKTGMKNIGPYVFNSVRFFVGFITVLPIAFLLEREKIFENLNLGKKLFFKYLLMMSVSLFLGTYLQQTSLLFTNVANAALRTVDFKGGLDKFLISAKNAKLSKKVKRIKASISAKS